MPSAELVEYQGIIAQNLRDIYPNVVGDNPIFSCQEKNKNNVISKTYWQSCILGIILHQLQEELFRFFGDSLVLSEPCT